MRKASTFEIRFHDSEMVVVPSLKAINSRKTAKQISLNVDAALDEPREQLVTDLIVDLSQVTWISSVGLNELIRIQARSRTSGVNLRLRSLTESVHEVLRITRLERIFDFEDEVDADSPLQGGADHQSMGGGPSQHAVSV